MAMHGYSKRSDAEEATNLDVMNDDMGEPVFDVHGEVLLEQPKAAPYEGEYQPDDTFETLPAFVVMAVLVAPIVGVVIAFEKVAKVLGKFRK